MRTECSVDGRWLVGGRGLLRVGAVSLIACIAFALWAGPAEAIRNHVFEKSFGVEGSGEGQFKEPAGVARNEASGDIYVVDKGNNRVERFDSAGVFIAQFNGSGELLNEGKAAGSGGLPGETPTGRFSAPEAIAVDNAPESPSYGDVYVTDVGHGVIDKFSATGGYLGQLTGTCEHESEIPAEACPASASKTVVPFSRILGAATDRAGQLWVYQESGEIDNFSNAEANEFLSLRTNPESFAAEPALAVDSHDNLYVKREFLGGLTTKLASSGTVLVENFFSTLQRAGTLAVDLSSDEVYFDEADGEHSVARLTSSGGVVEKFGAGQVSGGSGVAVDGVTGEVVVVDVVAAKVEVFVLEPSAAPTVDSESVSQVTGTSALLEGGVNPRGLLTEYHFEYDTAPYVEAQVPHGVRVPVPDGEAGSAFADSPFSLVVQGLSAGTVYHYRVVASNSLGEVVGPDRVFTTQGAPPPAGLADGRGWELVSPPNKHGISLESMDEEGALIQAAEDGHALTYIAKGPVNSETAGSRSSVNTQLLSARGRTGWSTSDISTRHEEVAGVIVGSNISEYKQFSSDLSVGLLEPAGATPLAPAVMGAHGERTPYRREANGAYTPLVSAANTPAGVHFAGEESKPGVFIGGVKAVTMTPDASSIVLTSRQPLTEGLTTTELSSFFEWSGGQLKLVSLVPPASGTVCGGGGPACVPAAEEGLAAGLGEENRQVRGMVSNDGSRVVFDAEKNGETRLFLRDVVRGESVQLDAPAAGVEPGSGTPVFQLATADGSRVFFTDTARLTADATAKVGERSEPDLYVCDIGVVAGHLACSLRDLTVDGNASESAQVLGAVVGVGGGGRFVYFVANGALAPGAVHGNCPSKGEPFDEPASASCNLFVRDVDGGVTSLVAVVSARDAADWNAGRGEKLQQMTARVSPSGEFLAFMSTRPLTGFDNRDARSGERDAEVFEFDRERAGLVCVSCDPSGARPVGVLDPAAQPGLLVDRQRVGWQTQWLAGSLPGWTNTDNNHALYQSRYLSDAGRLFFNSPVGLVSSDGNGREDVYEFEPAGPGCTLPAGCVALMSSGTSGEESAFLDASSTGNDVFFLSAAKLASGDIDGALDVYDARVCTVAEPCPSGVVSVPPACSTADSCRSAPAPQPDLFGAPASATFTGAGNVPSPPVKPAVLTRAQKLTKALHACRKLTARKRRRACETHAHKRYVALHRARKANTNRRAGR
jgi:hypothetical protein